MEADARELLYEGKAKRVYATGDPDLVIQHFKDDATAFNAQKRGTIASKGIVNCKMSEAFFTYLGGFDIPTHFVKRLSDRDMLVRRLEIGKFGLAWRARWEPEIYQHRLAFVQFETEFAVGKCCARYWMCISYGFSRTASSDLGYRA